MSVSENLLPPHSTLKVELQVFMLCLVSLEPIFIKAILLYVVLLEHKYDPGVDIHPNAAMARKVQM
jgi:hypothetical protein